MNGQVKQITLAVNGPMSRTPESCPVRKEISHFRTIWKMGRYSKESRKAGKLRWSHSLETFLNEVDTAEARIVCKVRPQEGRSTCIWSYFSLTYARCLTKSGKRYGGKKKWRWTQLCISWESLFWMLNCSARWRICHTMHRSNLY